MVTITKEQLRERARQKVKSLELAVTQTAFADSRAELEEELELARIALASLEADPIYQLWDEGYYDTEKETYDAAIKAGGRGRIVYTAQPAPVSVPDERYQQLSELYHAQEKRLFKLAQRINGQSFDKYAHSPSQAVDVLESAIFGEREEDCRAAMLHGADGNSPVIPGDVLSAVRKVACIRADFNDFDGDRRGIGDCLDEAEQDLIVTINKYASVIAAAPLQDTSRELFVSVEGDTCGKHPDTQLINHPHRQTASIPPHPVKYCPKCEPGVLPLKAFRIPDKWIFGAHTNCLTISCSVKSDKKITFVNSSFVNCSEPEGDIQFINCTLPAEWEGKVNAIDCVFKAAPQKEVSQALAKGMERYGDAMQELAKKEVK